MALADASLTSIRDQFELAYGVQPTGLVSNGVDTARNFKERRMVSETLGQDKEVTASAEIVNDRRTPDNIQVGSAASGDIVSELTGGGANPAQDTWDDYWKGAIGATGFTTLQGALPGVLFTAGTITPTNDGTNANQIILTSSSGSWPAGFVGGEFVYLSGFTGVRSVLNSIYKIRSIVTTVLTLTGGPRVPTAAIGTTEVSTLIGAFQLQSITDFTQARSLTIERKYSTGDFAVNDGETLTGFDVDIRPKQPMRVTWHFLGKEEVSSTATLALSNEVNTLTTTVGALTSGTFTLTITSTLGGPTPTATIAFNATAAQIQSALQAIAPVGTGNVTVTLTGGANISVLGAVATITWGPTLANPGSALGAQDITITLNAGSLVGGPLVLATPTPGGVAALVAAVSSRRSFSPVTDLRSFYLGDGTLGGEDGHSFFLNSFSLSFKNGAYSQDERAGNLGAIGIGQGSFSCTGSYEFYYDNTPATGAGTVHDQLQRFVDRELAVCVGNTQGDAWVVHLPRINWTGGRRATPGKSQAVKGKVEFQAAKGTLFPYLIKIARL